VTRLDTFSYHVFVNYTCQYNFRGDMWFINWSNYSGFYRLLLLCSLLVYRLCYCDCSTGMCRHGDVTRHVSSSPGRLRHIVHGTSWASSFKL